MRRILRTYISLILIALPQALLAQEVKQPVRPGTILLSAYQTVTDAEKLEEAMDADDAQAAVVALLLDC